MGSHSSDRDVRSIRFRADYTAAEKLVESGYKAIESAFNAAKRTGAIPKGRLLAEMLYSGDWRVPDLLDADKYIEFQEATKHDLPEVVLMLIWNILEETCREPRLKPVLAIDERTGHIVVRLAL